MRNVLIITLIIGFNSITPLIGQQYSRGNLTMGATVSLNSTRLVSDSIKYRASALPGAGIALYSWITDRILLNYGAQFSMKGVEDYDTLGKLRSYCIEPFVSVQYKPADNLRLEAGGLYSKTVSAQTIKATGQSSTGTKKYPFEGLRSYPEAFVGGQLSMNNQTYLGIRYFLPLSNQEFSRLELRLTYILVEGYSKRRRD